MNGLLAGETADCLLANFPESEADDPSPVPLLDGWYYFLTGRSCGGRGTGGIDSLGFERSPAPACP